MGDNREISVAAGGVSMDGKGKRKGKEEGSVCRIVGVERDVTVGEPGSERCLPPGRRRRPGMYFIVCCAACCCPTIGGINRRHRENLVTRQNISSNTTL